MNDYIKKYGLAFGMTMNLVQIAWRDKLLKMFREEFQRSIPKDALPVDLGDLPLGPELKSAVKELLEQLTDEDTNFIMASAMSDAAVMAAMEFRLSNHTAPTSDRLMAWAHKLNQAMLADDASGANRVH